MRKSILFASLLGIIVCGCTRSLDEFVEPAPAPVSVNDEAASPFIDGELIVEFSEDMIALLGDGAACVATKADTFNGKLADVGVVSYERLYPDAGKWEARHRAAGLHRWYRVKYDVNAGPAEDVSSNLSAVQGVVYSEPSRKVKSTQIFNDPGFSYQWDLYNDGSRGSAYSAGCDVNVIPVWSNYTAGSSNVIVAVEDNGVDMSHPDLAAICIPAGVNGSKCFLYDNPGYRIFPDDHGTHVSGTIAAINNNGVGICGIAGGKDGKGGVRIMSCQMMHQDPNDPNNTLQGDSYNAMVWAADHGAVISQNSWGYDYKTAEEAEAGGVGGMGPAIDYFNKYAGCDENGEQLPDSPMKGGLVVFAAGNDGWPHGWPAEYDGVVAVGAVGGTFRRAYYSNFGDWVDICAPGGDASMGPTIYSTVMNGYAGMQGTSMACPHVSGVAALLVSYYGGPGFTREMLLDKLISGANASAVTGLKIGPLLDALGSFAHGSSIAPDPVKDFSLSADSNNITINWKVTPDEDDKTAYGYLVLASKTKADLNGLDVHNIPSTVLRSNVQVGAAKVGDPLSTTFSGLEFETAYYVTIIANDYSNNYSAASPIKSVNTLKNNPPVVSTEYTGDFKVKPFQTLVAQFTVSDPDGHKFSVSNDPGSPAASFNALSDVNYQLTIVGKLAPEGIYTAHIIATDAFGASTDYEIEYEILENHAPVLRKSIDNILFTNKGEESRFNLDEIFYDEDGEPLSYSYSLSGNNVAHIAPSGNELIITALGYGLVEASVTATDACGKACTTEFQILVRDASIPVALYPNPVIDNLNISPLESVTADVTVSNKAGAIVFEGSLQMDPFHPAVVNMSDCTSGLYYVTVKGGSYNDRYSIVKK